MDMFQQGKGDDFAHLGLMKSSATILRDNLPLPEYDPLITQEVANFRFVGGTVLWFDIISSITSGTAPYLFHDHRIFLNADSRTKLEDIMGCRNTVMLQIGRIAMLHDLKTHDESFDYRTVADDIDREIQSCLTQSALEGFNLSQSAYPVFNMTSDPAVLMTCIFAHMATIYLHMIIHGFQRLEPLDASVSEAAKLLSTQVTRDVLPGLIAPLFITGLVAKEESQQIFRAMLGSEVILDPLLKHRARVLPCLEEVWSRRRITTGLSWKDVLTLTSEILLI